MFGWIMLGWILAFLILSCLAVVVGWGGLAGAAAGVAKALFFVFAALLVVSLFTTLIRRH